MQPSTVKTLHVMPDINGSPTRHEANVVVDTLFLHHLESQCHYNRCTDFASALLKWAAGYCDGMLSAFWRQPMNVEHK